MILFSKNNFFFEMSFLNILFSSNQHKKTLSTLVTNILAGIRTRDLHVDCATPPGQKIIH
jgi:hypothetical protein